MLTIVWNVLNTWSPKYRQHDTLLKASQWRDSVNERKCPKISCSINTVWYNDPGRHPLPPTLYAVVTLLLSQRMAGRFTRREQTHHTPLACALIRPTPSKSAFSILTNDASDSHNVVSLAGFLAKSPRSCLGEKEVGLSTWQQIEGGERKPYRLKYLVLKLPMVSDSSLIASALTPSKMPPVVTTVKRTTVSSSHWWQGLRPY